MAFDITQIKTNDIELFGNKGNINPEKRVLLVGLGGTGTDTLLITKEAILNRFKLDNGAIPKNIEFLAIDTDHSILEKRSGAAKIEQHDLVQLEDPMIGDNLNNKEKLPDFYRSWVNPSLVAPFGVGANGAGAIRQIGRYLLISNYKKVYNAIESKLDEVMIAAPLGDLVDVIILSGISGGTGSGTFIDMGYIIRKVFQSKGIGDLQKQITAYLFLPDVNFYNPKVPPASRAFIKVNGYAALKDLDYFMSIPEKKKVSADKNAKKTYMFRQQYTHQGITDTIESDDSPFDATYLVAGQSDVTKPVDDGYEYAINITADSIVNFIAGSVAEGHKGNLAMGVASVDVNGAAMKATNPHYIMPDGKKLLGVYDYKVIGASMASLPVKEITDYIAGIFLKKIDILKNQLPQAVDYDKFYKTIGLAGIENAVLSKIGNVNPGITGQDLKSNPQSDAILMQNLNKYLTISIDNVKNQVSHVIENLDSIIKVEVDNAFKDINRGPFFANRLMADGNNGVIAKLVSVATDLSRRTNAAQTEAAKAKADAIAKKNEADNATLGKARKYDDYIKIRVHQVEMTIKEVICKELAEAINGGNALGNKRNLVENVKERNKKLYDAYTAILTALADKFSNGNTVVKAHSNGRTFVWDIVSMNNIKTTIDNAINTSQLDIQMNNLLDDMIQKSEKWIESPNTLYEFGRFISDSFQNVLSISMDAYLSKIPEEALKQTIANLDNAAKERFPKNIAVKSNNAEIFNQVTVPVDAPIMKQEVQEYLIGQGVLAPPQQSLLCEKISWTRVSIGMSLFRYAFLPMCEEAYINMDPAHRAGLHIFEKNGVCGWDYPALLPKPFYPAGFDNKAEEKRYNFMKEIFKKAIQLDLVGYTHQSAYIKVSDKNWCSEKADEILAKYQLSKEDILGSVKSLSQIAECKEELEKIIINKNEYAEFEYIYLPDTPQNVDSALDEEYACEAFCRMPEAKEYLSNEIVKIESLSALIAEMDRISVAFVEERDKYIEFIYSFVFDILKQKGAKYVFANDVEEIEIVNLMTSKLWRYDSYKIFDKDIRSITSENIQKKINEVADSTDELKRIKEEFEKILNNIKVNESLQLKGISDTNAIEFYNKIKIFINDEIEKYSAMGI